MTSSATEFPPKIPRPGRSAPFDRERLKRKRAEAGLSQAELAAASGTSVQQISRLERGKSGPSSRLMPRLARALGCEVVDLMPAETGEAKSA